MKNAKPYNIPPAEGQAILNFQNRRLPDSVDVFETALIEEVRNAPGTPGAPGNSDSSAEKERQTHPNFTNLLIQGDCLSACALLKDRNVAVDLVYIDPPFASGANYAKKIYVRNGGKTEVHDSSAIGEEIMYGDIWQKEDYLNWLYERLLAIRDIMSERGSIYVHLDWHIGHYVKVLMDEVFGEENFVNEIVWSYDFGGRGKNEWPKKHDNIFLYRKNENIYFEIDSIERIPYKGKLHEYRGSNKLGKTPTDVWDIPLENKMSHEITHYNTQKPIKLLERIIRVSSDEGMLVADFFSGSGTTAKVAGDLNRKFIACDIGINAVQTTRDRLVKAGAEFDILRIQDGLRLFRNPAQTAKRLFSLINGFKPREELELGNFWDGGIAQQTGHYTPVKFSGIHEKLTRELLDMYLEEIYRLEDTTDRTNKIIIIYAHKTLDIDQQYLDKRLHDEERTELPVQLRALDDLLGEKRDALFTPDNAAIQITRQGTAYRVEITAFFSPYLKKKLDDYNMKSLRGGREAIRLSDTGLELIEAVQFDTTLGPAWRSNRQLEDRAGAKEKVSGVYTLNTNSFKMKIRNIAGDEIIINSNDM